MPFILSVECAADPETGRTSFAIETLQNDLFREHHCGLETCGWTPNFTVICEQDAKRTQVMELLSGAGCTVSQERRYISKQPISEQTRQRSYQPWNTDWEEVSHVQDEPESLPLVAAEEVSEDSTYEEQVLAFIHELQEILLEHHLAPNNLEALLDEARHMAEEEGEDGPHAGLVLPLRDYLVSHPEVMSA